MRRWIDGVGQLEALIALAGYAYEHPEDPFPDVDPFYKYPFLRNKRVMQVHASRGCQNSCTYCSVGLMKKTWVSGKRGEKFNRT